MIYYTQTMQIVEWSVFLSGTKNRLPNANDGVKPDACQISLRSGKNRQLIMWKSVQWTEMGKTKKSWNHDLSQIDIL